MGFWLYILRCADGSFYIGHTDNLDLRISQHQWGEIDGYTAKRLPVHVVFAQEFPTRLEALERERQLKRWGRAKKEALIDREWRRFSALARGPDRSARSQE